MADDKKKPPAPPSPFNKDHFQDTMIMLVVLLILGAMVVRFNNYLNSVDASGVLSFWQKLKLFAIWFWSLWKGVAVFLVGLGIAFGIYSKIKALQVGALVDKMYAPLVVDPGPSGGTKMEKSVLNEKWEIVLKHINSENPADWRLAIIEADIMLEDLLQASGYHGETVGDRLKAVEPSDMLTLDNAWEAHKIRNRIAHSGSDFDLNEREAKRVVTLFESVFKEFEII